MTNELQTILRGVGFTENEANLYIAALELGPSSIWQIAMKSGIKRPTCYFLLGELAIKGLASSTNDGKRVIYSVISPRQLAQRIDQKFEKFANSITQLEGLASKAADKPKVLLFEGEAGVLEVYNMTLSIKKDDEIIIYGTASVVAKYDHFIQEYLRERVRKGIKVRAILPDTKENRSVAIKDEEELRQTRFLSPDDYDQQTEVNIFGSSIAYIAHSEVEPFATMLESAALASDERQKFELLWELAGDRIKDDKK